jgi:hypothetical protein
MGSYGLDSSGSAWGPVEGFCEQGNEPSHFIKCWEVLEQMSIWQFPRRTRLHEDTNSERHAIISCWLASCRMHRLDVPSLYLRAVEGGPSVQWI